MKKYNNFDLKKKLIYWPFALGPLAMIAVYVLNAASLQAVCDKAIQEHIHIALIAIAFLIFLAAAVRQKQIFHFIMTSLCFSFLCRELHFAGTSLGVYIAIAVISLWTVSKWKKIEPVIERGKTKPWLYATAATYILSQLIARRLFRDIHLPNEQLMHVMLEETVETTAHFMMIITAVTAWKIKPYQDNSISTSATQQEKISVKETTLCGTAD